MQVVINDTIYEVPFDPALITLSDFVEYHKQYGADLDKKLKEILNKKYAGDDDETKLQREDEIEEHLDMEALSWYSFWTKYNLIEVRDHAFVTPVLHQYRILRYMLKEESEVKEFPVQIEWNGDTWVISDFKVNPASEMSFNEIITSKEIMRQVYSIGAGRWAGLPYLCAVYFRKKDEKFNDELIYEGGERMNLLNDLPLKYAMQVAFFLNICVTIWSKTLASSAGGEPETPSLN